MKFAVLAPLALALGTLALACCGSQSQPSAKATAKAAPDAPEGITVSDARLVLPAVKGNPGAVYFTLHNDSANAEPIKGAEVKGAQSAMIHQTTTANGMSSMEMMPTVAVPAHGELVFKPAGLHVMAMDLDNTLAKGGTTDVMLSFKGGDKAVFPAEILAAGDAR
ncbi:MAG TPA: copper chaperone PCu(A)C [Croceibacterium sp.]|nr:copper chaperone PCu(A)C [Croceibacterium sp.]